MQILKSNLKYYTTDRKGMHPKNGKREEKT